MGAEFQLIHLRDFEPVSPECLRSLPESIIRKQLIVPVAMRDGRLKVAAPHSEGIVKPEGLQMMAHCPVDLVIAPVEEIIDFIRRHYPDAATTSVTELKVIRPDPVPAPVAGAPAPLAEPAPAPPPLPPPPSATPVETLSRPNAVDDIVGCPSALRRMLSEAAAHGAREVLLEREGSRLRLRQRIRGVLVTDLREKMSLPEAAEAFSYVAERGNLRSDAGVRSAEMHFQTLLLGQPHACALVLSENQAFGMLTARLAPVVERAFEPVSWGMGPNQARTLESLLARRQGVVLFSGFEADDLIGTLHACLRPLMTPERHVIAVQGRRDERLSSIEQLLSFGDREMFGRYLQLAFRHSPDVVMAAPLERREHIETCLNEALGGRLVLAGFHAADIADTLRQFAAMSVERYLLSSAVLGLVAQRTLRLNCSRCQEKDPVDRDHLKELGIPLAMQPTAFFRGRGCDACLHTGFDRETSIFEVLEFNEDARAHLQRDASSESVRTLLHANGMMTLRQIAIHKAINGQTSLAEVLRATV